ncbi:hypothetical protein N7490_008871 [Penicillium lividum]|nr:hypothetical protein N7490_008871 [Penicillium lividum]
MNKGIAKEPAYYAFRDHFMLSGLMSNPAKLAPTADITTMFSNLYTTAEASTSNPPVRAS